MTSVLFFLILFGVGVVLIGVGISIFQGYRRFDYIFPHYYSGAANYASIPLGIMLLMWAFLAVLNVSDNVGLLLTSVSLVIGLAGLALNFIQPKFMRPQWYRWLEDNHEDILHLLHRDTREIGYRKWQKQAQTQEGLEEWVAEVRLKHRLEQTKPQSSA
jgi:hypothetical protein